MSSRKSGSPRRRESRSPVTAVRSGSRSAVQSAARRTARSPREGKPRWRSERWTIVRPSSSPGSRSSGHSSRSSRTQPASKCPHASSAATTTAAPMATAISIYRSGRTGAAATEGAAPGAAPPPSQDDGAAENLRSDLELVHDRLDRDDVALELELGVVEPGGDADELREVQDRHPELPPGRLLELRLPRVEREVAERARRHHRVRSRLHRLLDRLEQLRHGRLLARLDDREAA